MVTDANIERRCRYRLNKHGLRLHKVKQGKDVFYYIYEVNGDDSLPEDKNRYISLKNLLDYCEMLAEKEC